MARKIEEIQEQIFEQILADENLGALNSQSKTAIYRLIVFVVAFAIWVLEVLFDTHKAEVLSELSNQKSGTLPWYRTKALAFQLGFKLFTDSDKFNNEAATDEKIRLSKIIKYAAVSESIKDSRVIVKIAGETNTVLAPIASNELLSFKSYMDEIKYAGVKINVINYLPDILYLNLKIYRNPLLIDESGNSILNGGKPIEQALKEYMKELPFNGELVLAHLVDKLQQIDGVIIPHIVNAQSSWIDPAISSYATPQPINVKTIPVSGYYQLANFDTIEYVV